MLSAVVLDMGNVVLELNFLRLYQTLGLSKAPTEKAAMYTLDHLSFYEAYEQGDIDEQTFLREMQKTTGRELPRDQFLEAWNSIFVGEVRGIDDALARIARRLPLYALTNVNPLHMERARRYPCMRHFRRIFTSYELRCRKPSLEIFQKVAADVGFPPANIFYVDDREENVEGARRAGYQAELVRLSAEKLLKFIEDRGVSL